MARPPLRRPNPSSHPLCGGCLTFACAVKRRWSTAGNIPPGNWFAPPGSNRSSSGGNEAAEASGVEGRERRLGKFAGCNIGERCAGPETGDAGADPPRNEGKPRSMGRTSERFLSVLPGYGRRHADKRGPDATREAPAVIAVGINRQLARVRPGRLGWRRGP
jgi:hypothetical protein